VKVVADSGAWIVGPPVADPPAVAVLEVSGAVLAWTVDDPGGATSTRMTVTDAAAADWLWRVVGPAGHAAIASGVEPADVEFLPEAVNPLRRLAVGHWLRRWWPESSRDGIVRLDRALLDGELALLTNAAEEYFTEDTLDSHVEELLAPHRAALLALEQGGDPRVVEMVRACARLADETGAWPLAEKSVSQADSTIGRRDDYALAAGADRDGGTGAIAGGTDSVDWVAVPPGIFDAADATIDWSVESVDASLVATVRVGMTGETSARGIEVRLRSGTVSAAGVLDTNGTAALTLVSGAGLPISENQAWDHDWSATTVAVGPNRSDVPGAADPREIRRRVRGFAKTRLARPGPDAFLAEIVAAESDY
jgi:hypothetical protein